jgi:hypothetical protein
MLMRILADNPGQTFTRNFDKKFVEASKELLKTGRDPSVRQMLMETLDAFEQTKSYDEGLGLLIEMWKKERDKAYKNYGGGPVRKPPVMRYCQHDEANTQIQRSSGPRTMNAPAFDNHSQNYFSRSHSSKRLPDPIELANRLEEARTSAKLLTQVVQCTAPSEVLTNDLIKEFADRCHSASRSIMGYMEARDPGPDNETMESLIDTNEQLQQALNLHKRALLNARKHLGLDEQRGSQNPSPTRESNDVGGGVPILSPPALPIRSHSGGKGKDAELPQLPQVGSTGGGLSSSAAGPSRSTNGTPRPTEVEDPFRDPEESRSSSQARPAPPPPSEATEQRLAYEPFSPGFSPAAEDKDKARAEVFRRQESAVQNKTMYGGASGAPPVSTAQGRDSLDDERGLYDDDGPYEGGAGNSKQPMYRY